MAQGDEAAFEKLAAATLGELAERVEDALGDVADVEFNGGILTITLDGGGQYVVNKHAPLRQIWLSSPVSGATHYDRRPGDGAWIGTRDGAALLVRLGQELSQFAGRPVPLE